MSVLLQSTLRGQDRLMTSDRSEVKYLLDPDIARAIARAVSRRLEKHRHQREGVTALPGASHHVTTTYFDTESREIYRSAAASETNVKLRAKEYYDIHPDLVELATDRGQLVRASEVLWLEIKRRDGLRSGKQRIGIPKSDVSAFFAHGTVTPEMLWIQVQGHGDPAGGAVRDLHALAQTFCGPLRPDCLVNYRRVAWQSRCGALRITLDSRLAFFAPPVDLFCRRTPLLRECLGAPAAESAAVVLEIKTRGPVPDWLETLLSDHGCVPVRHSKFLAASLAVRGAPAPSGVHA